MFSFEGTNLQEKLVPCVSELNTAWAQEAERLREENCRAGGGVHWPPKPCANHSHDEKNTGREFWEIVAAELS